MIERIRGILVEKSPTFVVVDVNGVGYLLFVSGATLQMAPQVGERMKLYSVLNVREDAMELFGFYSREEKAMYERLKGVSGVGSRTALQILSAMSVRDLSLALVSGDANALTRVPGIGKKTAQRMILELKGSLADFGFAGSDANAGDARGFGDGIGGVPDAREGVLEALLGMGFTTREAELALKGAPEQAGESVLLQYALKKLGS